MYKEKGKREVNKNVRIFSNNFHSGYWIIFRLYAYFKAWNNGSCECGCEWTFSNVEHLRNSDNLYYWYCEDCGKVIELHTQFTK